MKEIFVRVPGMTSRQQARALSAVLSDVEGVETVEVDVRASAVRITGEADPEAVRARMAAVGFPVTAEDVASSDGSGTAPGGRS